MPFIFFGAEDEVVEICLFVSVMAIWGIGSLIKKLADKAKAVQPPVRRPGAPAKTREAQLESLRRALGMDREPRARRPHEDAPSPRAQASHRGEPRREPPRLKPSIEQQSREIAQPAAILDPDAPAELIQPAAKIATEGEYRRAYAIQDGISESAIQPVSKIATEGEYRRAYAMQEEIFEPASERLTRRFDELGLSPMQRLVAFAEVWKRPLSERHGPPFQEMPL